MKYYNFGESNMGDIVVRNKAKLDDGTIVEYDQCCLAGGDPRFGLFQHTKYLGRGVIYEVNGVLQRYEIPGTHIDYYDFWKVYN